MGTENFPYVSREVEAGPDQEACSLDSSFLSVSDNFDMTGIVDINMLFNNYEISCPEMKPQAAME